MNNRSTFLPLRIFTYVFLIINGPGSSVSIVTGYGLDGPGIESRRGARFSAPVQTGPGAHRASCTMGTWSFPEVKSGRGVTLTPHPLLVPWSRNGRAIPLLPLRAVGPEQSLSACTRVHFRSEIQRNHEVSISRDIGTSNSRTDLNVAAGRARRYGLEVRTNRIVLVPHTTSMSLLALGRSISQPLATHPSERQCLQTNP